MADENLSYNPVSDITFKTPSEEQHGTVTDPLSLDIEDDELVKIIDKRIKDSRFYYKSNYDLYSRRKKNEMYLFGKQIEEKEREGKVKDYETRNLDNVLYEIQATIKPLAMSQLPDLTVTPGDDSEDRQETAKLLTKAVNEDVKSRNNRQVLALAFKHRPVYFVGIIKAVWNPELAGGLGDYEFVNVHPDAIDFDYNATSPDAGKMNFISHLVNENVEQLLMKFPQSKAKFMKQLSKDGILGKDEKMTWKAKATPIEYREVWFTYYKEADDGKFQKLEGVVWKYKDVILGKIRNPNFDYEGEEQIFSYGDTELSSTKRPLGIEEMKASLMSGVYPENVKKEQIYHNYFTEPQKPFYFMTYDQWGKQPIDETSDLEQNIKNQASLDTRIKQIEETLNDKGHHIWSKESGLKSADIERMDHNNPDEDYVVDGSVQDVHEYIQPARPSQQEFSETNRLESRMFSLSGANAVRGQIQTDVATTNQIAREGNFTRADDLVEDTINAASEWMARWALQFIKLRYTKEHLRQILGSKGETVFVRLHRNLVSDGMEVRIKASGTDKIKAQNNAMQMAKLQLIDPVSFYQDMGLDNPSGRAVKLLTFMKDPISYMKLFIAETPEITEDLLQKLSTVITPAAPGPVTPQGGVPGSQPPVPMVPGQDPNAMPPVNPQQPIPGNTAQAAVLPPMGIQGSPSNL